MCGNRPLNAAGKHFAAILLLQVCAAAHMVGVGMSHQNTAASPALLIQYLAATPAGILITAAVDEVDLCTACAVNADFSGTLDVIAPLPRLYQFIHRTAPALF